MIEETVLAEQDPAERSHEVVERELERQDGILAEGNGQTLQSADQATFVRARPPEPSDNLIINSAADGTRYVKEHANDWPSDDPVS